MQVGLEGALTQFLLVFGRVLEVFDLEVPVFLFVESAVNVFYWLRLLTRSRTLLLTQIVLY